MIKNRIFKIITFIVVAVSFLAFIAEQFGFLAGGTILIKILFIISAIIAPSVAYDYLKGIKAKVVVTEDNNIDQDAEFSDIFDDLRELQLEDSKFHLQKIQSTSIDFIDDLKCYFYRNLNKRDISQSYNILEKLVNVSPKILIIGDSGSGKTTLTHQYIYQVFSEKNNNKLPLFLSLSKYKGEANIIKWMADTIEEKFSVKNDIIERLIRKRKIILCLDGLDEVSDLYKTELVNKLKSFAKSFPILLTCRTVDFYSLPVNFKKEFSFCELLPLNNEQIVNSLGNKYNNTVTQKLSRFDFVKTPLILNVIATISDEFNQAEKRSLSQLQESSEAARMIWEKYDLVMFKKKLSDTSDDTTYNLNKEKQSKLRYWLVWLAKHTDQNSSDFMIEQMQPNWLSSVEKKLYYLTSRLLVGIFISIGVGFFLSSPFDLINIGVLLGAIMGIISYLKQHIICKMPDYNPDSNKIYHLFSKNRFIDNIVHFAIAFIILSIVSVIYMGFTVPRKPDDMIFGNTFATTEAYAGIFISLFFATIFGFRNHWQTSDYDIRPVEQLVADWRQFFTIGLIGGISLAVLLFICAVLIQEFFAQSTFGLWLTSEGSNIFGISGPLLGLFFGFVFGFPIFAIIGWLNYYELSLDKEQKSQKKFFSNYGIRKSLKNALLTGLMVWIILGGLYGLFIWFETNSLNGLLKGIREGFGAAIIASLWFGGAEFIQHWSIRLTLYVYGKTPFLWTKYLKYGKSLTFLRQEGANYSFYHRTLKDYFRQKSANPHNIQRLNNKIIGKSFFIFVLLVIFFAVFVGLNNRFNKPVFWESVEAQPNFYLQDTTNLKKIAPNSIKITKDGELNINAKGKYKIGTFSGYISPNGTEIGFLGMPIGNEYDSVTYLPHGSLIYRNRSKNIWKACFDDDNFFNFSNHNSGKISVAANDTIDFLINDSEWQNNTGTIKVELALITKDSILTNP